jgi:hypothetical protein
MAPTPDELFTLLDAAVVVVGPDDRVESASARARALLGLGPLSAPSFTSLLEPARAGGARAFLHGARRVVGRRVQGHLTMRVDGAPAVFRVTALARASGQLLLELRALARERGRTAQFDSVVQSLDLAAVGAGVAT